MAQGITKRLATGAFALIFIGLSLAACSDDSNTTSGGNGGNGGSGASGGNGGSGGSGGTGGSSSQGEQYADVLCGKLLECCDAAGLAARLTNTQIQDYAGCHVFYRTFWDGSLAPMFEDSEAAGRSTFDDPAFDACLGELKGQACADFLKGSGTCSNYTVPKVEKGGACTQDFECITKECDVPSGAAEGTCVDQPPPAAEGAACEEQDDCATGLYCANATDTCAKKKADGEACSNNQECTSVACEGLAAGMGKCATVCQGGGLGPGPIDAALDGIGGKLVIAGCKADFECCTPDELKDSLFDSAYECRVFTGAFLGVGLVGIHNDVVAGKVSIDGAKLAACADAYATRTCLESSQGKGFECDDAIVGLVKDGSACTENRQCESKYCNEPAGQSMGVCGPFPAAGAPCVDDCIDGYYCSASTCTAQLAVGATCTTTASCIDGKCIADTTGAKTCTLVCDGM